MGRKWQPCLAPWLDVEQRIKPKPVVRADCYLNGIVGAELFWGQDGLQGTVLTSAINTLVRGTCAAHCRQFLRNGLPGAMESYGRIIGGRAPGPGKGLHGFSSQINMLNCCTVLGLQVADDFLNACTCFSM
jgi:hypothetical protein